MLSQAPFEFWVGSDGFGRVINVGDWSINSIIYVKPNQLYAIHICNKDLSRVYYMSTDGRAPRLGWANNIDKSHQGQRGVSSGLLLFETSTYGPDGFIFIRSPNQSFPMVQFQVNDKVTPTFNPNYDAKQTVITIQ